MSRRIFSATTIRTFKTLFARLSPQDCALCGSSAPDVICAPCEAGLPRLIGPSCTRCAAPLAEHSQDVSEAGECGVCLAELPYFDHTITAFRYDFPVDRLIQAYKFRANLVFTGMFADAIVARVLEKAGAGIHANTNTDDVEQLSRSGQLAYPLPDLVMPTPLAAKRLAERGFNQSALLGRAVALRLEIKFLTDGLQRVRETRPQSGLKREERLKNVRGAFACDAHVEGKRIAIVDDVMTTGATFSEAAKALKNAGAIYVEAWACARASHPHH